MIKVLCNKIAKMLDPVKFWRKQGAIIGVDSYIFESASFGSEPYLVTIGNRVRINGNVQFVTHDGGVWVLRNLKDEYKDIDMFGRIVVGDNVHIGTNAMILPGVTIGNNCIIGCGAIVTKDIPSNSVAVGIPARVIESISEYEAKNSKDFVHTKRLKHDERKDYIMKKIRGGGEKLTVFFKPFAAPGGLQYE